MVLTSIPQNFGDGVVFSQMYWVNQKEKVRTYCHYGAIWLWDFWSPFFWITRYGNWHLIEIFLVPATCELLCIGNRLISWCWNKCREFRTVALVKSTRNMWIFDSRCIFASSTFGEVNYEKIVVGWMVSGFWPNFRNRKFKVLSYLPT